MCRKFRLKNLKEGDHFEVLSIGGSIMLKRGIKEIWLQGVDWIHMAQDRDGSRLL
jgi:hypothetical protein